MSSPYGWGVGGDIDLGVLDAVWGNDILCAVTSSKYRFTQPSTSPFGRSFCDETARSG